jgi:hypothetical protein
MRKLLLVTVVLGVVAGGSTFAAANFDQEAGAPAQIVDFTPDSTVVKPYATTDYSSGTPVQGTTDWRVITGTGNAAELWLTTTQEGRLYDLGGRYLNYSDDRGLSWKSVRPIDPLVNGEGSVVIAPNGDVLGVTWDPYAGDRVWTYKYSAAEKKWYYSINVFHTPFWDRPGIDVIPGPFTTPTGTVPYITFINGFPHDEWHYSLDGLNYPFTTSLSADEATTADIQGWIDTKPDASFDWIQPNQYFPFGVLGGGKALMGSLMFTGEDMHWHKFSLPAGAPALPNGFQVDSRGWLHSAARVGSGFVYRISSDGGRSWKSVSIPDAQPGDLRANAAAGVAAVWGIKGTQDLLYKIDISTDQPRLLRRYVVGKGDDCRCQGIGFYGVQGGHRYDFPSVAIFPDGRLAVSFMDSTTKMKFPTVGTEVVSPGLAIELDTTLPAPPAP